MPLPNSKAPRFQDIDSWVNGDPINIGRGTYLLDFWNYSCSGCRESAEKLQQLHSDHPGLEVVGVHSSRFDFEEKEENVRKAAEKLGIDYPIAIDSENSTRQLYGNRHGPQRALVHDGEIVWTQAGNSSFDRLERKLSEVSGTEASVPEIEESGDNREVHLGFNSSRGVNERGVFSGEESFEVPEHRKKGEIYLEGNWRMDEEFIEAGEDARLYFKFDSPALKAVIAPGGAMKDVDIRFNSEDLSKENAGEDVRVEDRSYLRLKHPDLQSVVEGFDGTGEIVFEPEEGVRFYSLTLG